MNGAEFINKIRQETVEMLSIALFVADTVAMDGAEMPSAVNTWRDLRAMLNEPPYANGGHAGDCIRVPQSCIRCLIDGYRRGGMELWLLLRDESGKE